MGVLFCLMGTRMLGKGTALGVLQSPGKHPACVGLPVSVMHRPREKPRD